MPKVLVHLERIQIRNEFGQFEKVVNNLEHPVLLLSSYRCIHNRFNPIYVFFFFQRFNVAITRAQALLILIGNPDMLRLDENWRRLVYSKSYICSYIKIITFFFLTLTLFSIYKFC